jgi:hypothetical protein
MCSSVDNHQRFGGTSFINQNNSILNISAAGSSEMSVSVCQIIWRHISEDNGLGE